MKFGDYLRQIRETRHWTQPEAAARAGIEQSYLSKLETGKSYPSDDVFGRLVQAYEIDVKTLVRDLDPAEAEALRDIESLRTTRLIVHRAAQRLSRGWMLAGLACLLTGGGSVGAALTVSDTHHEEYIYMSRGVIAPDEPLNVFDIIHQEPSGTPAERATVLGQQIAMLERVDEDVRIQRTLQGEGYIERVEGGRRYYQALDSQTVVERSPLRWFWVPGLMLLFGALGCFTISWRWK
ncbi:helix-turn-helix domain-containing protein [Maricaulis parjimensis]|uniref:helix-turn-helix domain-containing protein n=1 Tax=Maricaulis parjimensis TaxID=144023 RepID=UPI001939E93D|nr:helix-turn-helix transcriptional regulator [Maricaulis parjimensis]